MTYRKKINSIEDLDKLNLVILNKDDLIKNNLKKILKEKKLKAQDLSNLTGICRQNISQIINNKMIPGIVLASQIATVLGKSVEDIFELTDNAWVKIAKVEKDKSIYIDLHNLEIVDNSIRKEEIKNTGLEYINLKTMECLNKKEYESKRKEYKLQEDFEEMYSERYKKLGEKINPITIKSKE